MKPQDRTSLVVHWIRIHPPMQGTQLWSLIQEDSTFRRATKSMLDNYWAWALESTGQTTEPATTGDPAPQGLCSATKEANTRSPHSTVESSARASRIQRKSTHSNGDPEQPKQTNNHKDKNPRRRQGWTVGDKLNADRCFKSSLSLTQLYSKWRTEAHTLKRNGYTLKRNAPVSACQLSRLSFAKLGLFLLTYSREGETKPAHL